MPTVHDVVPNLVQINYSERVTGLFLIIQIFNIETTVPKNVKIFGLFSPQSKPYSFTLDHVTVWKYWIENRKPSLGNKPITSHGLSFFWFLWF